MLYLITEGHTERDYFDSISDQFGGERDFVIHYSPVTQRKGGADPEKAVKIAKETLRNLPGHGGNATVEVWAIFDRDQHKNIPAAIREAEKAGIKVAFSHPSFDLWLALHFVSIPLEFEADKDWILGRLRNARPSFRGYGKDNHRLSKRLTPARIADLEQVDKAKPVKAARALVERCSSGCCAPDLTFNGAAGHVAHCDPDKRATSTDVYRILETLGIVQHG